MKVLIIGGYGTFGFGIAERLSNEAGLELVLAGRNLEKAKAACAELEGANPAAKYTPLALDRNKLALDFKPDLIVDASGPFQAYEHQTVVDYCLEHVIPYADISDDGAFVEAITKRISEQVPLISGLSTCPVLSAIGLREVERVIGPAADITIGIAPSPKADLGRNVVAAVANYAGQKIVPIRRANQRALAAGLTETRAVTICVPGDVPLPRVSLALADAPDAVVLPESFPALTDVWTGAGTRPVWLLRILVFMSKAVAKGLLPKLAPFAGFFHRTRAFFSFGKHRGGFILRGANVTGEASWHLVAEGDHGPRIPALPVVALIRKMLRGETPKAGTYSGDQIIGLADMASEFAQLDITYGLQYDGAVLPIYEKIMGSSYAQLHPAVAELHRTDKGRDFIGECTVTRGKNPLSHIVAAVMGFPKSGENIPVTLKIELEKNGERWTRNFAGKSFNSFHRLGTGKQARLMIEKFGPIAVHMAILADGQNMRIETQGWTLFGIPLPKFLRPGGDVYETEDDQGRFVFHVDLIAPIFGRLCKYEGWFVPVSKSANS